MQSGDLLRLPRRRTAIGARHPFRHANEIEALLTIERARTSDAPTLFDEDPAFGFARKPKLRSRR